MKATKQDTVKDTRPLVALIHVTGTMWIGAGTGIDRGVAYLNSFGKVEINATDGETLKAKYEGAPSVYTPVYDGDAVTLQF